MTRRPSRCTWDSMAPSTSVSGCSTPSTRFSSRACSALMGVRSSWLTLATRSRRSRSLSASSAAMRLKARRQLADLVVGGDLDPPAVVALGHVAGGVGQLEHRSGEAPGQHLHHHQRQEHGGREAQRHRARPS